jgi:hypothetical protein
MELKKYWLPRKALKAGQHILFSRKLNANKIEIVRILHGRISKIEWEIKHSKHEMLCNTRADRRAMGNKSLLSYSSAVACPQLGWGLIVKLRMLSSAKYFNRAFVPAERSMPA